MFKKITLFIFIIVFLLLITKKNNYNNENFLIGNWLYNEEGSFTFDEDKNFTQYQNSNLKDNYCIGKYQYSYGTSINNTIIKYDKDYYYYNLILRFDYCYINSEYSYNYEDENFSLAINKKNKEDIFLLDSNQNILKLNKRL